MISQSIQGAHICPTLPARHLSHFRALRALEHELQEHAALFLLLNLLEFVAFGWLDIGLTLYRPDDMAYNLIRGSGGLKTCSLLRA